jgi:hypothetical protein
VIARTTVVVLIAVIAGFAVESLAFTVPGVEFTLNNFSGSEADSPVKLTVILTCPSSQTISVDYNVTGTATPGSDYALSNGQLTFHPGDTSEDILLTIINDAAIEPGPSETIIVTLSNPANAAFETGTSLTYSIIDNDDPTWPGDLPTPANVSPVDVAAANLGANTSGITCQPTFGPNPEYLWIVKNNPCTLHRLSRQGATWVPSAGWPTSGLTLRYPLASGIYPGAPDSEGVTKAEWIDSNVYVCAERNGSGASRLSVLRYDTTPVTGSSTTIDAAQEWVLNHVNGNSDTVDELPSGNAGWEGITWIPDAFLVAHSFKSDAGATYNPGAPEYVGHGSGLFFLAMEDAAKVYIYALNAGGSFKRIGKINVTSLQRTVALEFDRDNGLLWVACDDACVNRHAIFEIDGKPLSATFGHFVERHLLNKPANLPVDNFEGFALAPASECNGQTKEAFWVNDSGSPGSTLYRGTVPCGCSASDSDNDGVNDCDDACPADPLKIDTGNCGCGHPDLPVSGDMDGLNGPDLADISSFVAAMLSASTLPSDLCAADFNRNQIIDGGDVAGMVCLLAGP